MPKKLLLYINLVILGFCHLQAQTVLNTSVIASQNTSDPYSVRLLPGFNANAITNPALVFRAYIAGSTNGVSGYTPITVDYTSTPPPEENYIYSRSYLIATTATNPAAKQIQGIQFFDGLGRPKQNISIKSTPSGKDLVTTIPYDDFGRQVDSWLPVPMSSLNGDIQSGVESATKNYYKSNFITSDLTPETIPFSHKVLEASPLNRLDQEIDPGFDWQSKPNSLSYDVNNANEVKKFGTSVNSWTEERTDATLTDNGFYPKAVLYKNRVTDEDGNYSIEFKNSEGQTLLVRKNDGLDDIDTYYVYNEFGQLSFVIPPKAVANSPATDTTVLNELCYQYRYDSKNRLAEKKLPGKDWEYMVYDNQNRLVATQDGNLKANTQWLFSKYDQFSRTIYTGITNTTDSRATIQTALDGIVSNNEERKASGFTQNNLVVDYSKDKAYPSSISSVLSVNYYDTYPAGTVAGTTSPSVPTTVQDETPLSETAKSYTVNGFTSKRSTKSLPTASFVKNIEDDKWTRAYSYYDSKARTIATYGFNIEGGFTKSESKLLFSGNSEYTITTHSLASSTTQETIKETFEYDHQERLVRHFHQINGGKNELLAENIYNELGQLKIKNVGNLVGAPLQSINYKYNIRGQVTQVNDPDALGNKLFGYQIFYNTLKKSTINGATTKFNGNISQVAWATQGNAILRVYSYNYDGLDRLKKSTYWDDENHNNDEYQENLSYDLNGNINTLFRTGKKQRGTTAAEVYDNLKYHYSNGEKSNKLLYLEQLGGNAINGYPLTAGQTGQNIQYDGGLVTNGNMTSMPDEGVGSISYNFLDLPTEIKKQKTGDPNAYSYKYTYGADGVKLKQTVGTKVTTYLDGFQYENNTLQFLPTAEGYYDFIKNAYVYNYNDQVGNVRVSYKQNTAGALEILEENNYYAFGLKQTDNDPTTGNTNYKYKFQGQEYEDTGFYSFKWRNYDPVIGRFFNVDKLSEKYAYQSHYNFSENRVVNSVELEGLEEFRLFDKASDFMQRHQGEGYTMSITSNELFAPVKSIEGVVINAKSSNGNDNTNQMSALPIAIPLGGFETGTLGGTSAGITTGIGLSASTIAFSAVSLISLVGDTSVSTTDQPENDDENLYLYRNMRSIGGLPELGSSANTLGVRNTDFSTSLFGEFKSDTDYVYGSSGEGMSTTPGFGNYVPITPYASTKTSLFRINAANVYKSGLGVYIDKPNHANIIPRGRMTLQQFRLQIQATAPLWKPIN